MTGFIGAGKMAEAIFAGMIRSGMARASEIGASDVRGDRLTALAGQYGIIPFASNQELVVRCDPVVLAVKPQDLDAVLCGLVDQLKKRCVISIAAGRTLAALEDLLPDTRVVRVMPNLACQVGEGMSVLCGGRLATAEDLALTERVFAASGLVCTAPESDFDMVTAVSGSGPAFWTQVAQYQQEAAVAAGMDAETARKLILQTMRGTASVLSEGGLSFDQFMDAVASKGGTTAAGLAVLRGSAARTIWNEVLGAAAARSRALRT